MARAAPRLRAARGGGANPRGPAWPSNPAMDDLVAQRARAALRSRAARRRSPGWRSRRAPFRRGTGGDGELFCVRGAAGGRPHAGRKGGRPKETGLRTIAAGAAPRRRMGFATLGAGEAPTQAYPELPASGYDVMRRSEERSAEQTPSAGAAASPRTRGRGRGRARGASRAAGRHHRRQRAAQGPALRRARRRKSTASARRGRPRQRGPGGARARPGTEPSPAAGQTDEACGCRRSLAPRRGPDDGADRDRRRGRRHRIGRHARRRGSGNARTAGAVRRQPRVGGSQSLFRRGWLDEFDAGFDALLRFEETSIFDRRRPRAQAPETDADPVAQPETGIVDELKASGSGKS